MRELGSSETQDQTGTKITVPLKTAEDRIKFEKELSIAQTLESKPILKGFVKKIKHKWCLKMKIVLSLKTQTKEVI